MLNPMNPRSLENPDRDTLERFLREHLSAKRFVQVAAECEVVYVGRAASLTEAVASPEPAKLRRISP